MSGAPAEWLLGTPESSCGPRPRGLGWESCRSTAAVQPRPSGLGRSPAASRRAGTSAIQPIVLIVLVLPGTLEGFCLTPPPLWVARRCQVRWVRQRPPHPPDGPHGSGRRSGLNVTRRRSHSRLLVENSDFVERQDLWFEQVTRLVLTPRNCRELHDSSYLWLRAAHLACLPNPS